MSTYLATFAFALLVFSLFMIDPDRKARTSKALWLPTIWVLLTASRMVSQWLQMAPQVPSQNQILEGSPLDRLVFSGLLLCGILVLICRSRRAVAVLRMNWPILLFFFYCGVSTLWSDFPGVALKRWIKALGDLVMILIVLTDRNRFAAIKRLLARAEFILIPLSVLLIEYYPMLGRSYSLEDGVWGNSGAATNKNMLGLLCLVVGLASVWHVVNLPKDNSHRIRRLVAHGTVLLMTVWLFYMANSVTSLTSFLLGSGLLVVSSLLGKVRPKRIHLAVAGVACVALIVFVLPDVFAYFVHAFGRKTTLTGRTQLWGVLLKMDTHPWLGTGFESFWLGSRLNYLWSIYYFHPNEAHNGYLEVFLNLGWIGVGFLAVLLVTGYRNVIAMLRRDPVAGQLRLGYFAIAIIYSFAEAGFRMLNPVWIFFLFAITAVPEGTNKASETGAPTQLDLNSVDPVAVVTRGYEGPL